MSERDAHVRPVFHACAPAVRANTEGTGPELHSPEAHEAITAELVRLTLGGRGPSRPELRERQRRHLAATAVGPRFLRKSLRPMLRAR